MTVSNYGFAKLGHRDVKNALNAPPCSLKTNAAIVLNLIIFLNVIFCVEIDQLPIGVSS